MPGTFNLGGLLIQTGFVWGLKEMSFSEFDSSEVNEMTINKLIDERAAIINDSLHAENTADMKPNLKDRLRKLKLIRLMKIERALAKLKRRSPF